MLQYNKLYQSLKKVGGEWHAGHFQWYYYWNYIKFYEDGTLIYCASSEDDFDDINKWFSKSNENVSKGKHHVSIDKIKLDIQEALIDGFISNDTILLKENKPFDSWDAFEAKS